jgi:hypothetical protein
VNRSRPKRIQTATIVTTLVAVSSLVWSASASASSPPTIESESASNITPTDATLEAQINPNGAYTAYAFQIARSSSYDYTQMACPLSLPNSAQCLAIVAGNESLPPGVPREPSQGSIPAGTGDQTVTLDLASIAASLQSGTTYHYRVIASNGGQVVSGTDQTFTTPAGTGPPSIESESVSGITQTDATLEAQINTHGLETSYEFHLISAPPCLEAHPPCERPQYVFNLPSGKLLGSFVAQSVSIDLDSAGVRLMPGERYEYSVTATNSAGSVTGAGHGFEALLDSPSIASESVSNVTSSDATLEAQINPQNPQNAAPGAYYQFQLVTNSDEYASEILCQTKLPSTTDGCNGTQSASALPIGFIPGNTMQPGTTRTASLDLTSAGVILQSGTTYHYRVLVARRVQTEDTIEWEAPTVYGADQMFTTTSSGTPPEQLQSTGTAGQLSATGSPSPTSSAHYGNHRRRHRRRLHRVAHAS